MNICGILLNFFSSFFFLPNVAAKYASFPFHKMEVKWVLATWQMALRRVFTFKGQRLPGAQKTHLLRCSLRGYLLGVRLGVFIFPTNGISLVKTQITSSKFMLIVIFILKVFFCVVILVFKRLEFIYKASAAGRGSSSIHTISFSINLANLAKA